MALQAGDDGMPSIDLSRLYAEYEAFDLSSVQRELESAEQLREKLMARKRAAEELARREREAAEEALAKEAAATSELLARASGLEAELQSLGATAEELEPVRSRRAALASRIRDLSAMLGVEKMERLNPEFAAREKARLDAEEEARVRARQLDEQVAELLRAVEQGLPYVEDLTKDEIFNQLCIWAGRARILQSHLESLNVPPPGMLRTTFGLLTGVSKRLQPGYCAALERASHKDWEAFVHEHVGRRQGIVDAGRRYREEQEERRRQEAARKAEELQRRQRGLEALDELRALIHRDAEGGGIPPHKADDFRTAILACLRWLPSGQEDFLDTIRPFSALLSGKEFKAVRRALGIAAASDGEPAPQEPMTPEFREMLLLAREAGAGRKLAVVGGRRRPDAVEELERLLEPKEVQWVETDGGKSKGIGSLAHSVRSGGKDLVLVLTDFVAHNLRELEQACATAEVPLLRVTNGCGLRAILGAMAGGRQGRPAGDRV